MYRFPTQLMRSFALAWLVAGGALSALQAHAAGHEAVSADAAALALADNAVVVDVRSAHAFSQGHLPGARPLPQDAAAQPVSVLARLLSEAGADLSRTVLVVGEPGAENAHALWQTLSAYATGRVLWLVGGTPEWQMAGYGLSQQATMARAVPQHLVRLHSAPTQARMAGAQVRASSSFEPGLNAKWAASPM
jgi:3-mercaptopyruvate sulfurtransferase SseA